MNYWGEITFNDLGWFGGLGGMDILKPGKAKPSYASRCRLRGVPNPSS